MQPHLYPLFTVLLCATALTAPAFAQDDATALGTIVITASRTDLPARAVGSAATVVEREEILREQNRRVSDVLRGVPGVQVSQARPGLLTSVSIRGSDNDQVLVLVDGVRVADPSSTTTAFRFDHLSAADIERIEVLRGNQSSLYGSDAIGGVINIITRRAETDGWQLTTDTEVGPDGWKNGNATLTVKQGAVDARVTAYGLHYDGPSEHSERVKQVVGPMQDTPYQGNGLSTVLGWQIAPETRLEFSGMTSDTRLAYDNLNGDAANTVDKDEWRLGFRLTHESADGKFRHALHGGTYSAVRTYYTAFSRVPEGDLYDGQLTSYGYDLTWKPNDQWSVVGGVAHEEEETVQITNYSGRFTASNATTAVFGEVAYTPDDINSFTLAARRDDNDRFGSFDTWRLTAAHLMNYGATEVKLRASAGTGAKAPSLYQLFDPTYGNANLTAQESRGFDLGADVYLPWGEINATLFQNDVENKIAFDFTRGYYNEGETQERGLELGVSADLTANWQISASHTYVMSTDELTGAWRGQPKNTGSISATYAPDPWSVTARVRYASANHSGFAGNVPGYAVADLFGSYHINDRTELYARVENIFDREYETDYGYRTPDRTLYAGIRIGLGSR